MRCSSNRGHCLNRSILLVIIYALWFTIDWGAYEHHLNAANHQVAKQNTQKIERKNLNLRTWIKNIDLENDLFFPSQL
jgi:IS1 family transposase